MKRVDREFNYEKVLKTNRQKPTKYYTGLQVYYGPYLQTYIVVTEFCQVKLLYLSHPQHFEWACTHHLFLFIYLFIFNKTNQTHEFPKFYFVKILYMIRAGSGSNLTLLGRCHQTYKEYTIGECAVDVS